MPSISSSTANLRAGIDNVTFSVQKGIKKAVNSGVDLVQTVAKMAVIEQKRHDVLAKGCKLYLASVKVLNASGRALTSFPATKLISSATTFNGMMDLINLPCTLFSITLLGKAKNVTVSQVRFLAALVATYSINFGRSLVNYGVFSGEQVRNFTKSIPLVGSKVAALNVVATLQALGIWLSVEGLMKNNTIGQIQKKRTLQAKRNVWSKIDTALDRTTKLTTTEKYKAADPALKELKLHRANQWDAVAKANKLAKLDKKIKAVKILRGEDLTALFADGTKLISSVLALSDSLKIASFHPMVLPIAAVIAEVASFGKPTYSLEVEAVRSNTADDVSKAAENARLASKEAKKREDTRRGQSILDAKAAEADAARLLADAEAEAQRLLDAQDNAERIAREQAAASAATPAAAAAAGTAE